ncbi:MAG: hypothetical protein RI897_2626 [Verrucomicrobiota bacterium]|jgi:mono/diheme cytochrome c family protein
MIQAVYASLSEACMTIVGFMNRGVRGALRVWLALALVLSCRGESLIERDEEALRTDAGKAFEEVIAPFVKDYCQRCHGQDRQRGGINLESAVKNPGETAANHLWKQVIAVIKSSDMPPQDVEKQPLDEERRDFLVAMGKLKYLSVRDPGLFVIRRLNKLEYGNTLHDLLGVDASVADELPDEVFGAGYLNTLSPLQTEQYLEIANSVLDEVFGPSGSGPAAIRRRWVGEVPEAGTDQRVAAGEVARSFARAAYRRPPSETELDVLLDVFDLARENGLAYLDAVRLMFKAVLVSPQFLYITPSMDEVGATSGVVSLDDYQLASRLSYLLWATMPDEALSSLADSGRLHEPEVLRAQVKRMLDDDRARGLFDGFGSQWLGLGDLEDRTFDEEKFPQMTSEMRAAMYDEARLFFEDLVRHNRGVIGLVDADYTFLNGTLAAIYGLEGQVQGPGMRKVDLEDRNRGGILGMPGVLATTSFPNRTSPVKRGVWVLEQVLGEHIPPPPPNVPALDQQERKAVENLTLRERTELHVSDPTCANCHKILDPIGFGLENFDAIGRWREQDDSGGGIDASGELPTGERFSSPAELKVILAGRVEQLARNLTEKLLAYALCRPLEGYDEIVVDELMRNVAGQGYGMQTIIAEIAASYPFGHRRIEEPLAFNPHEKAPSD